MFGEKLHTEHRRPNDIADFGDESAINDNGRNRWQPISHRLATDGEQFEAIEVRGPSPTSCQRDLGSAVDKRG